MKNLRKYCLLLFLLPLPLLFNPITGEVEQVKVFALIATALLLWITQPTFESKQKALLTALVLFMITVCLSTFLAEDTLLSLWGSEYRFLGAFAWIAAASLAMSTASIFKNNKVSLLKILASSGTITTIIAFTINPTLSERLAGTLGNPNVLGKYLLFTAIISLGLYLLSRSKTWLFFSLIQITGLIATGNRASLIVLFAFLVIAIFHYIKSKPNRIYLFSLLLTTTAGISVFTWNRIADLQTVSTRLELYLASTKAILEKPFFGYGFGHTEYILDLPRFTLAPDRAHQFFLDTALSTGLIGMALLTFISASTLFLLIKSKAQTNKIYGFALLALLLSTQVSFLTAVHLPLLFIGVGLTLNLGNRARS